MDPKISTRILRELPRGGPQADPSIVVIEDHTLSVSIEDGDGLLEVRRGRVSYSYAAPSDIQALFDKIYAGLNKATVHLPYSEDLSRNPVQLLETVIEHLTFVADRLRRAGNLSIVKEMPAGYELLGFFRI